MSSLRDAIKDHKKYTRELRDETHIANLLKMLELNLISKENVLNDPIYKTYKDSIISNTKVNKKSLF